ncbi:hypothetical protein J8I82_37065 [Cupriavidus sp. LEh25]|nr:hypothetical protein [Cupriavidus sp. LEh25]
MDIETPFETNAQFANCRLAVALQIGPRRRKVCECGFRMSEAQFHDPAGGVVDIDQQRAGWGTLLKPAVIAAVDLDQFAIAGAPVPRLVDLRRPLFARHLQAGHRHQPADGFLGQRQPMTLAQLLGRERCFAQSANRKPYANWRSARKDAPTRAHDKGPIAEDSNGSAWISPAVSTKQVPI